MNVVNECSEWRIILYIWNKVVVKFIQMNVRKFVDEVCDELKLWWSCDEVVMKYLSLNCCDKALHHKLCESFVMKSWIVCCGRIVKVCDENVLKNCFIDCWMKYEMNAEINAAIMYVLCWSCVEVVSLTCHLIYHDEIVE